jgi:hypothetical protein
LAFIAAEPTRASLAELGQGIGLAMHDARE